MIKFVGIGIGAVIGFALLASLCVCLWVLTVIGLDNAGTIHVAPGECWAGVCKSEKPKNGGQEKA